MKNNMKKLILISTFSFQLFNLCFGQSTNTVPAKGLQIDPVTHIILNAPDFATTNNLITNVVAGAGVSIVVSNGVAYVSSTGGAGGSATNAQPPSLTLSNLAAQVSTPVNLLGGTNFPALIATTNSPFFDIAGASKNATNGLPSGIWNLGSIAIRGSNDFYLASNPSGFVTSSITNGLATTALLNTASNVLAAATAASVANVVTNGQTGAVTLPNAQVSNATNAIHAANADLATSITITGTSDARPIAQIDGGGVIYQSTFELDQVQRNDAIAPNAVFSGANAKGATNLPYALKISFGTNGFATPVVDPLGSGATNWTLVITNTPASSLPVGTVISNANSIVTSTGTPTLAATNMVQGIASAIIPNRFANEASAAALPAYTYAAGVITETGLGALVLDGITAAANDKVLIKDETTKATNGLYDVTVAGSGAASFVLTRDSNFNTSSNIFQGDIFYIDSGTVNSNTFWTFITPPPYTVGTTPLTFVQTDPAYMPPPILTNQVYSTNILTQSGTLAASSQNTNYTVALLPGSGGGDIQQIFLSNTNAYISFTGTNVADTKRTVLFRGWTNTVNSSLVFNLWHWRTNNPAVFNFTVSNGWSAFFTFYNPDTTGSNCSIGDDGRIQ
jgi:hypothetical protein